MKASELKSGMTFEGAGEYTVGDWLRITQICDGRVYFVAGCCRDSCDLKFFPAIEHPNDWIYTGYAN